MYAGELDRYSYFKCSVNLRGFEQEYINCWFLTHHVHIWVDNKGNEICDTAMSIKADAELKGQADKRKFW